jgi:hypothetical protein
VTRDELVARTRQLIDEGERLNAAPGLGALQLWLQLSDDLLRTAWGSMDRFHMAWLSVGRPKRIIRGRPMTSGEEAAYVHEVVAAKGAVLRSSLDAAERLGLPFVGETGGVGPGGQSLPPSRRNAPPPLSAVSRDLLEARRQADAHREHPGPRAPRPEKMQR